MACQHAVGAVAAKRIARPFQMADALEQHLIAGALINRQIDVYFGDFYVAQALAHVHQVHIACAGVGGFARHVAAHGIAELFVVAAGRFFRSIELFCIHGLDGIVVAVNDRRRMALCHRVADDRVHRHADARQNHQRRKSKF